MDRTFVVTATGLISAAGETDETLLAALVGRRPLAALSDEDDLAVAAIDGFDAKRYIAKRGVKDLSRASQLACSAAAANARGLTGVAAEDIGVVFGSAWGSVSTVIEFEREAHVQGARFVDPILFTETVANVPAGQVAILYGWSAFNMTVSAGAASGVAAIRQALAFLEEGRAAVAVAGGGDALNRPVLRALRRRGLVGNDPGSLPLAASRAGPIGSEGACFLTLESPDHAKRRGAAALAAIRASAGRFVAGAAPGGLLARASLAELIRELATAADLALSAIDLVVLSASGQREGDVEEGGAVLDVFGDGRGGPPVIAPKGVLGETWGASGVLAVAAAIAMMRNASIPAAPNGFTAAPELSGLNVPHETLRRPVRNALILDRTDSGEQFGLVVSSMESHDPRH